MILQEQVHAGDQSAGFARTDDLQDRLQHFVEVMRHPGHHAVGMAFLHHHSAKIEIVAQIEHRPMLGHPLALEQFEIPLRVLVPQGRILRFDDLDPAGVVVQVFEHSQDLVAISAQQNGLSDTFPHDLAGGPDNGRVISFRKDDPLRVAAGADVDLAHELARPVDLFAQLFAVQFEVDVLAGHAATHGRFGYGRRRPH